MLETKVPVAEYANSLDLDEVAHNEPPHQDLDGLTSSKTEQNFIAYLDCLTSSRTEQNFIAY